MRRWPIDRHSDSIAALERDRVYQHTNRQDSAGNQGNSVMSPEAFRLPETPMTRPLLAITTGDVAGIGPEVVVRSLIDQRISSACRPVVIGHPRILREAIALAGLSNRAVVAEVPSNSNDLSREDLKSVEAVDSSTPGAQAGNVIRILCWNPAGDSALSAGRGEVSKAAGEAAFQYLEAGIRLALDGIVAGIVTAPLNKAALHAAGHDFPGHTEILADRCHVQDFAMMLHLPESAIGPYRPLIAGLGAPHTTTPQNAPDSLNGLSIAHVTLHTSVASVPTLLTEESVVEKVHLLDGFLRQIGSSRRQIGVCALNPHGGEGGLFGQEEADVIEPAIRRTEMSSVTGPWPVDTLIRRAVLGEFDGVVAMYHDQGHIPVKLIGFDSAINITRGLPIIRTSPTHGTAFDRAWKPNQSANSSGMTEAILMAAKLAVHQA